MEDGDVTESNQPFRVFPEEVEIQVTESAHRAIAAAVGDYRLDLIV